MNNIASVIIVCYENYDYIFDTIDSVLEQTYPQIEIIVADDGFPMFPKDKILTYIEERRKENIIRLDVYSNEHNVGTVRNLNTAIRKSIGDFILSMASDDAYYNPDTVSLIVNRLQQSNTGMICCRRVMTDIRKNELRFMPTKYHIRQINKLKNISRQHIAFAKGEFYEMASGSCTYYKRERLFNDGLYDENYVLLEDWPCFLMITKSRMLEFAYDIVSIKYRTGGISGSHSPLIKKDYVHMINSMLTDKYEQFGFFELRYLKFCYERYSNERKFMITCMKYPDAFISRSMYKIKCILFSRLGKSEFNHLG